MKLNPNVTFSITTSISCTSTQEEMELRDIRAESLAWQSLIARVHKGEVAPFTTVGKRLLSLVPMHVTEQTPMSWAEVFRP